MTVVLDVHRSILIASEGLRLHRGRPAEEVGRQLHPVLLPDEGQETLQRAGAKTGDFFYLFSLLKNIFFHRPAKRSVTFAAVTTSAVARAAAVRTRSRRCELRWSRWTRPLRIRRWTLEMRYIPIKFLGQYAFLYLRAPLRVFF